MDIANIYHCGYHLFTDDHFTTYIASDFALHKGTFITGAMHCNQLKHSPPPHPEKKNCERYTKCRGENLLQHKIAF